jgi:putative thioredoxin
MINVTIENFDAEVVAASHQVPVLLDFGPLGAAPAR